MPLLTSAQSENIAKRLNTKLTNNYFNSKSYNYFNG